MSALANTNAPAAPAPDLVKLLALAERVSGLETCGGLGPGMLLSSLVAEAREALDSNAGVAETAPKRDITFDQLPLASCSLSPQEAGRWLSVILPLLKYAGSPGDWGRESKLGVLTMRLMQARAEIMNLRPEDVFVLASAPYVHVPRRPEVSQDYPDQRYFARNEYGSYGMSLQTAPDARIKAFRMASADVAQIRVLASRDGFTAEVTTPLTATELRELATVLLDAAHDIECNSSTQLLAEIEAARGAP